MKHLSQGLWLALSSTSDATPSYMHFAGAYLETLLARAEKLRGLLDAPNISEARMHVPAAWAMFSSSLAEWDDSLCCFPSTGMELACSGRLNLWLTAAAKGGGVEVHTAPFTLEELRQAVEAWKKARVDIFSLGYQQLDTSVINDIADCREERTTA